MVAQFFALHTAVEEKVSSYIHGYIAKVFGFSSSQAMPGFKAQTTSFCIPKHGSKGYNSCLQFDYRYCSSQLKPPPFGSQGRVRNNGGIKSLLKTTICPLGVVNLTNDDQRWRKA